MQYNTSVERSNVSASVEMATGVLMVSAAVTSGDLLAKLFSKDACTESPRLAIGIEDLGFQRSREYSTTQYEENGKPSDSSAERRLEGAEGLAHLSAPLLAQLRMHAPPQPQTSAPLVLLLQVLLEVCPAQGWALPDPQELRH